jgi:carbon starvation protein CstA
MALSLDALGRVLQHIGRLLLLRADLAAEEVGLLGRQWLGWVAAAFVAMAMLIVAFGAAVAWLTLVLWDRFGMATAGVAALALALGAVMLLRGVGRAMAAAPPPLVRTRTALSEDYEALAGTVSAPREPGPGQ